MVQRLAYLAFTEEAGVRLPVTEYFFLSCAFRSPKHLVVQTLQIHRTKNMLYVNFAYPVSAGRTPKGSFSCNLL